MDRTGRWRLRHLATLPALVILATHVAVAADAATVPDGWLTPAEEAEFSRTPDHAETMAFLERLAGTWDGIRLETFGHTAQGRPMPLVVVATGETHTPEAVAASGKALLLIQNGIHAGEIDGKDACLMLLRDLALGRHREFLDRVVLLIVPIYNVDGHERVSRFNRPNQDGPREGMGFRTTADGHDLNRDHIKLDTPEARRLIAMINRWRPHFHVDDHVTDGVDHDWVLTYSWAEAPQIDAPIDSWLREHMPKVIAATRADGHRIGPYASLVDRADPSAGIDSWVGAPRYSGGYFPLRHLPSVLVENHSYKDYESRVRANHDFLLALWREIASDPDGLVAAVKAARARTVALGEARAEPSEVVLRYRAAPPTDTIRFPVYDWYTADSVALGVPQIYYRRGKVREIEVPWKHQPEVEAALPRPRGYLVLPGWPAIEERLEAQGLRIERLDASIELDIETVRIANPRQDPGSAPSYQGRTRIEVDVERRNERRSLPAGTLWIPANQPDFEVAVQMLEPDAVDSLVSWGIVSSVLERKEYIDTRVLEGLVLELLKDPETAAEWKTALEQDEGLAEDWSARWLWWYRRTPYWDETVGLMPVLRLTDPAQLAGLPIAGGSGL